MIRHVLKAFPSVFSGFCSAEEQKKFSLLALILGLTIGVYWVFRPIKDSVFLTMIGYNYQPWAKVLSMLVMAGVVLVYSKIIDMFPRHKVLYGLSLFYAFLSIIFAFLLFHPQIGIENTVEDPYRYVGWLFYLFVESFGSTMVALFWSFVADTTTPDSAKRGYSLIMFGAQTGGVIFPLMSKYIMRYQSTGAGLLVCVVGICLIPVAVWYFMGHISSHEMQGFHGDNEEKACDVKKPKMRFLDGLKLFIKSPYALGIFVLVSFYEILITLIDFQFKCLAKSWYTGDALTDYLTNYAIFTNVIAVLCIVFGAKRIAYRLGLTRTLLLLPLVVGISTVVLSFGQWLGLALGIMVMCKSINYSLNQPSKEQLYIPTSTDLKYKAKAWIDMFGIRCSKGLSSSFNMLRPVIGAGYFSFLSLILAAGLLSAWILVALFLGKTHAKAIKENKTIC